MAIWYRASFEEDTKKTFSGEGGLYVPGRWNHLGKKAVYCSDSIALCTLEWLANNGLSVSGFNYYRFSIDVPDNVIKKFTVDELPEYWDITPSTDISRDFAELYLYNSNKTLALAIPSVIVPEEYNLIINPIHRDFLKVIDTIKMIGQYTVPER